MTDDELTRRRRDALAMHGGRPWYYDRQGNPIYDVLEWAKLVEHHDYKIVTRTVLPVPNVPPGDAFVSTVWLGIDHNFAGVGAPIIFETMVFVGTVERLLGDRTRHLLNDVPGIQLRYSTEAEAMQGHELVVAAALRFLESHDQGRLSDGDDESGERETGPGIGVVRLLPSK